MALDIIIKNEDDAISWLEKALNNDSELNQPISIKFDNWPVLDLHYKGHDFDSSVPTRVMPPLLDAQKEIHRLFCHLRYGEQNLRKLKDNDREILELVVKVEKGSSNFFSELGTAFTQAAASSIKNMESKDILIAIISVALVWGSTSAWKSWLDLQAKSKEIDSRVQMSDLEKEKLGIMSKARATNPGINELADGVNNFRNHSLNKLKPADSFQIPGTKIEIDGKYAHKLTDKPREESIEKRIDGEFIIQSV